MTQNIIALQRVPDQLESGTKLSVCQKQNRVTFPSYVRSV